MKKILLGAGILLGLSAAIFYSKNPTLKTTSSSASTSSAELASTAGGITEEQMKTLSFSSDNFRCSEDNKLRGGFSYKFKRSSQDLLKGKSALGNFITDEKPIVDILLAEDKSKKTHFTILDNGLASLYKRLELIEKAEKSIELEYFIYRIRQTRGFQKVTSIKSLFGGDTPYINSSTVILTQALIKKAAQGVKVRVLIDASGTILDFTEDLYSAAHLKLQKEAAANNIKYNDVKNNLIFKYYNNVPIIRGSTLNFRNHRKLFMVDDKYAITGGRNIEDKYFDMDPYYNFHDRDVLVTYKKSNNEKGHGKILGAFKNSFDVYWSQNNTSTVIPFVEAFYPYIVDAGRLHKYTDLVKPFAIMDTDYSEKFKEIMRKGKVNYDLTTDKKSCNYATFVSDRPINNALYSHLFNRTNSLLRGSRYKERFRFTNRLIEEKIQKAIKNKNTNLLISSPYFSLTCRAKILGEMITGADATLDIFTNSLSSTDAVYNAALFYERAPNFIKQGARLHVHSSRAKPQGDLQFMDVVNSKGETFSAMNSRWGLHSKSHVYGDDAAYIGTYNIDNRSSFYNSEMGVFCEDTPSIAKELRDSIMDRATQSSGTSLDLNNNKLVSRNTNGENNNPYGEGATAAEIKFMDKIFGLVEKIEVLF